MLRENSVASGLTSSGATRHSTKLQLLLPFFIVRKFRISYSSQLEIRTYIPVSNMACLSNWRNSRKKFLLWLFSQTRPVPAHLSKPSTMNQQLGTLWATIPKSFTMSARDAIWVSAASRCARTKSNACRLCAVICAIQDLIIIKGSSRPSSSEEKKKYAKGSVDSVNRF